jgi:hypothetical protein
MYFLTAIDILGTIFMTLWLGVLLFICYGIIKSCLRRNSNSHNPPPRRPGSSHSGSAWFPGDYGDDHANTSPPPYSKTNPDSAQSSGWRPGFWTGAALGGLGATLFNNRGPARETVQRPAAYDWEWTRRPQQRYSAPSDDRGEGSSNLGAMRRSIGLGGSNVR